MCVERDEPEPFALSANESGECGVASLVALHAFVVREDAELLQMVVAALEIELLADDGVAARAIEKIAGANFAAGRFQSDAGFVEGDGLDGRWLADFSATFRGVIEEHFVEPRALDLIRAAVFELDGGFKVKTRDAASAGGGDFAAVFFESVGLDFIADAEAVEGLQRVGEKGLADFETRKFLLFAHHDAPALAGKKRGGSRPGGAAADDGYVVEIRHRLICAVLHKAAQSRSDFPF